MTIYYHIHHIVPKHMGGTDDPSNLIKLTVEQHAEAHKKLWEEHGKWQDYIAYKVLCSEINQEEAKNILRKEAGRLGGLKSKRPKSSYSNGNNTIFRKKASCPYCNKTMDIGNLAKYHGNKCKFS
jgi:hypothetical protein